MNLTRRDFIKKAALASVATVAAANTELVGVDIAEAAVKLAQDGVDRGHLRFASARTAVRSSVIRIPGLWAHPSGPGVSRVGYEM